MARQPALEPIFRPALAAAASELNDATVSEACDRFFADSASAASLARALSAVSAAGGAEIIAKHLESEALHPCGLDLLGRCRTASAGEDLALAHEVLDIVRYPVFLQEIAGQIRWTQLICDLVVHSGYSLAHLIKQRIRAYPDKTLFNVLSWGKCTRHSWRAVGEEIGAYGHGMRAALDEIGESSAMVAFLSSNSLEMALLDLACLSAEIVNVMIPADATADHLHFILEETRAPILMVSGEERLKTVTRIAPKLTHLRRIVRLDSLGKGKPPAPLEGTKITSSGLHTLRHDEESEIPSHGLVDMNETATIMYTSGTTGQPKGIVFTQGNIVTKRFCRALALPEIGDEDRFLSYLPLCHTFGRWLEMVGSVFWAAEYSFLENPSIATIIAGMKRVRPTIFISIPKKWQQLYEKVGETVDLVVDDDKKIRAAVAEITGSELRWGLSAAGWLSPEIFRFFQRHGIEVMSGFGMTEATGGITMTPPGRYREESLGLPLPGIECRLAEDGELLVRGPYVTDGVFGEAPSEKGQWLHTGDIMRADDDGFLEIIDRKKAIYKNSRGETIAPQRIEKHFEDLEPVHQAMLVGDQRPHNTLLIHPEWSEIPDLPQDIHDERVRVFFSSLIVGVNAFLAPFERIVDFRLIDRAFSAERGELTSKGTLKRKAILAAFPQLIEEMYSRNHIAVRHNEVEIRIPSWFLREHGCLADDIIVDERGLHIPKLKRSLNLRCVDAAAGIVEVGDYLYCVKSAGPERSFLVLEVDQLLTIPLLWLGNRSLAAFAGEVVDARNRSDPAECSLRFYDCRATSQSEPRSHERKHFSRACVEDDVHLDGLHLAVLHLRSPIEADAAAALSYFRAALQEMRVDGFQSSGYGAITLDLLRRPELNERVEIRRLMLLEGCRIDVKEFFESLLTQHMEYDARRGKHLLSDEFVLRLAETCESESHLGVFEALVGDVIANLDDRSSVTESAIPALFRFLVHFCRHHPASYKRVRQVVVEHQIRSSRKEVRRLAGDAQVRMRRDLREFLGENKPVAIDVETGREYRWRDVIGFDDSVEDADRKRLHEAIEHSAVVREAVFLFSGGRIIGLHNIPPGGIWVSLIGVGNGKRVFRVMVQTRHMGAYDLVLNLNESLSAEEINEEIEILILAGQARGGDRLVEDFGGWWPQLDLWSEEYVSGETVARYIEKRAHRDDAETHEALEDLWPVFVWSAAETYFNLARRMGFSIPIPIPSPEDIIVSPHDYQSGTRLVSIAHRKSVRSLTEYLEIFAQRFVRQCENRHAFLKGIDSWRFLFAGVLDVAGEIEGSKILRRVQADWAELSLPPGERAALIASMSERLEAFLTDVSENGFVTQRLYFAIRRYHRWLSLNRDAALNAQAQTLMELYETYGLRRLESRHPGSRCRFFLETVFRESDADFVAAVRNVAARLRKENLSVEEAVSLFSTIHQTHSIDEREAYFLARVGYPHLRPTDLASLQEATADGEIRADLVVHFRDRFGDAFQIRSPVNPREISRLHRLFTSENLRVDFRPDHRFLVAISERGHLVGGIYYFVVDEQAAHMEKVVVSHHFRGRGIGQGLMNELLERLRDEGFLRVTTGFFRPTYFYRMGFRTARHYAGLVRYLDESPQ